MPRLLHPNASHVADTLISRGHHGVIVNMPEPTVDPEANSSTAITSRPITARPITARPITAAAAAATIRVDVGAIVESLVLLLDDDPVLLLVSGAHRVDLDRTGKRLEGTLTSAPEELIRHSTGQPIGGIAPVGHPTNLPTFVDESLAQYPELWAAAGHLNTMFRTTYSELLRITAGLAVDVT